MALSALRLRRRPLAVRDAVVVWSTVFGPSFVGIPPRALVPACSRRSSSSTISTQHNPTKTAIRWPTSRRVCAFMLTHCRSVRVRAREHSAQKDEGDDRVRWRQRRSGRVDRTHRGTSKAVSRINRRLSHRARACRQRPENFSASVVSPIKADAERRAVI